MNKQSRIILIKNWIKNNKHTWIVLVYIVTLQKKKILQQKIVTIVTRNRNLMQMKCKLILIPIIPEGLNWVETSWLYGIIMSRTTWVNPHSIVCLNVKELLAWQPILAKKICDIYKFQIFKKITIFHNILNIKRRLCLDCIRHFQRATSQGYIIW